MKRQRPKYEKPLRPYDKPRIEREKKIMDRYGLKRKREIWRTENILRKIRKQVRDLIASYDEKRENELRNRLLNMGLISEDDPMESFLSLSLNDLLERRLQTVVYKKGMANTPKQARQFIVHGHIAIDGRKVDYPSYFVSNDEEDKIDFYERSPLRDGASSNEEEVSQQEAEEEVETEEDSQEEDGTETEEQESEEQETDEEEGE